MNDMYRRFNIRSSSGEWLFQFAERADGVSQIVLKFPELTDENKWFLWVPSRDREVPVTVPLIL